MVEGGKHHTASGGYFQRIQTMVFGVKVGWHTTIDFAILAHASSEWNTLEFAIQGIAPLMVRAHQFFFIAMAFSAKRHAAMRANILDDVNLALLRTGHDDRSLTNDGSFEIPWVWNFSLEAHIAPVRFVKESL